MEPLLRLLAYDRRRFWMVNGWSLWFRVIDFFGAVERACEEEGAPFDFSGEDLIEDEGQDDETGD